MRLFVGIPIPEHIKDKIVGVQKKLPSNVRLVQRENLHITLKFLGESQPGSIIPILSSVASNHSSFRIDLKEVGTFPHVIWIGIKKNPVLLTLIYDTKKKLEHIKKEEYASTIPHLTIARTEQKIGLMVGCGPFSFTVSQFTLYKSDLHAGGSMYTPLQTFDLQKSI